MYNRKKLLLATVAGLAIAATSAGAGTFVAVVPFPNSSSTSAFGINDHNIVTGDYVDSSGVTHGFIGPFDGSNYTSFDDPDGTTQARAINDHNVTTGFDTGTLIPWERNAKGILKDVMRKGAPLNQVAQGINNDGVFTGNFLNANGISIAYLGRKSKFQSKVKVSLKNAGRAARAIDAAGDVVGWYYDPSTALQHGFILLASAKRAKSIDYPGAVYTAMEGLNNKGTATGQYQDASGVVHGFTYDVATGKMKDITAPGATTTQAWGINNNDVVAISATNVGSFAYCIRDNCPTAKGVVQHPTIKTAPAMP